MNQDVFAQVLAVLSTVETAIASLASGTPEERATNKATVAVNVPMIEGTIRHLRAMEISEDVIAPLTTALATLTQALDNA
jgi:hypothetical protein